MLPAMRDAIMKELQSVVASALSVTATLISKPTPYHTELTGILPVEDKKIKVNVKVHTFDRTRAGKNLGFSNFFKVLGFFRFSVFKSVFKGILTYKCAGHKITTH